MIPFIQQYSNSFPKASKTDYHKLSNRNAFLLQLWKQIVKIKGQQDPTYSVYSVKTFPRLFAIATVPSLVATPLSHLHTASHCVYITSLCLSLFKIFKSV